ncbi:hypothetical protein NL676_021345 [Syzygium grande]|nr:hypothetical protein NL676_021345 [Syzygium grande]
MQRSAPLPLSLRHSLSISRIGINGPSAHRTLSTTFGAAASSPSSAMELDRRSLRVLYLLALVVLVSPSSSGGGGGGGGGDGDDSIVARFQRYLRINTAQPNPDYPESTGFLLAEGESLSLEGRAIEFVPGKPVVLLRWPGSDPSLPSVLLNSHTDVMPAEDDEWSHPPFAARADAEGRIYARGSQDMKCVGMQYLEAIRRLKRSGFAPLRDVYLSFVPDEEIGGHVGAAKLAESDEFRDMNVGIVLDEGVASPTEYYRAFYGQRGRWWLVIKATGAPGHGAKLYDNTAMENLLKSIESVRRFRASQFDMVKAGLKAEGEVISVNLVFLKAGTPSPTGFVMNLQPSEAEAGFDVRIPPTADPKALMKRLAEEWAPITRNMTYEFKDQISPHDKFGNPILTATDSSNPWWALLEEAVKRLMESSGIPRYFLLQMMLATSGIWVCQQLASRPWLILLSCFTSIMSSSAKPSI